MAWIDRAIVSLGRNPMIGMALVCGAAAFGSWLGAMPAPQARAVVASQSSHASHVSPAPAASIAIAGERQ